MKETSHKPANITKPVTAALMAIAVAAAGCSSGKPSRPTTSSTKSSTSAGRSPSFPSPSAITANDPTDTDSDSGSSDPPDELDDVLITADAVGDDFTETDSADPSPLPGTPDEPTVDEPLHDVENGRVTFDDASGTLEVSQQIYVYRSEPVSSSGVNAELVLVRIHPVIVQFTFATDAKTEPDVDAEQVINTAVGKVLAAQ
jgi:hypothetical protein